MELLAYKRIAPVF